MDKKTVKEMLKGAAEKDYIEIITKMTGRCHETEKIVIDWCKKNNKAHQKKAVEVELENLWGEAQAIISDFNEYGGGPEFEEEKAGDNLWKMDELVREYDISWDVRRRIINEMLEEYYAGNSGFDDQLIEVADSFCKEKEERRYLADELAKGRSDYYSGYAARIYKEIGDEEQYLNTKLNNLRYGSDYVEIAKYYAKKGDQQKAMEYIWKGLEKSSGRLDELIDYAAPIYIKENNEAELRRLYDFVMKTNWDTNIFAIARQLYEYSGKTGNYEAKKKMLMLILDTCDRNEIKKWFETCKKELTTEDWEKEYEKILSKVNHKNQKLYLDICMETGREETVLKCIQGSGQGYNYQAVDCNQYFSSRLAQKYPEEIIELYWREVNWLLRVSDNKNYEMASVLLKKIKTLMKKNKKEEEWKRQFEELKEKHKKKRNFIALLTRI